MSQEMHDLAEAFQNYEDAYGVEELGEVLAQTLAAISARTTSTDSRIWPVETDFVVGRVAVTFSPGERVKSAMARQANIERCGE